MAIGRTGGAGQVWPDSNVNYLSKRISDNGEAAALPKFAIVALRRSNNGSKSRALLLNPTNGLHTSSRLGVVMGGFGTRTGALKGTTVDWAFMDLDTSASANGAPVYVVPSAPGIVSLAAGAGAMVVGKVARVGSSATDIANTVLLDPNLYNSGASAVLADPGAGTFVSADMVRANGGSAILVGTTTRILPAPVLQGQTISLASNDAAVVTYTGTFDGSQSTATFAGSVGSFLSLIAVPAGPGGALLWRILGASGITLS